MLPSVDFCGLNVTRLVIGSNPFGGFSHQTPQRDEEMLSYYTIDRIKETWKLAERAGINTMLTHNESPHVLQAVREYFDEGGSMQWIAQINKMTHPNMAAAIAEVVDIGCKALYIIGFSIDDVYENKDEASLRRWVDIGRSHDIPVGVAGHFPEAHLWVNSLDVADFHAVCFFHPGRLHRGEEEKFKLGDVFPAAKCIRSIEKPCIAYKIMGGGRLDPLMAFEYAFDNIKPTDIVNVGMYRGDNDNMVAENAAMVRKILAG